MTVDEARRMLQQYARRTRDDDTLTRVPSERETMAACIVLDAILTEQEEQGTP
jgi:hypothetical protein